MERTNAEKPLNVGKAAGVAQMKSEAANRNAKRAGDRTGPKGKKGVKKGGKK